MAWADITTYTADEMAIAKAEIDEVISAIGAKFIAHRHRNGKLTDEEHYAEMFVDQALIPRAAEFSTKMVGGLIAAATYSFDGDDVFVVDDEPATKANIVAEITKVIDALELDDCDYSIKGTTYTAPTAAANGSYKFKVDVIKAGKVFTTAEITATIVKLSA